MIILQAAVALLTFTFTLASIQAVAGASVTLSDGHSREIPFRYQGDTYQTWVSIYGGEGSGVLSRRPLPLDDPPCHLLRPNRFRRSTHLTTKPDSFFSIDLFLAELNNLLTTLGISNNYDLIGHSWGGVLGSELAVTKPPGLKKLIITDSLASAELWAKAQAQQLAEFPKEVQEGLAVGFNDVPTYRAAMGVFFAVHGCTVKPWPRELNASFDYLFGDPTVNIKMAKPRAGWTIIDRLHNVDAKTLVLNGAADMAQDFVIQPFVANIPGATHVRFEHSSHTPFWEEREAYMRVVSQFLDS